ncbi:MAG: hypothetical protein R3D05_17830 [Dongiaceae bacterium]
MGSRSPQPWRDALAYPGVASATRTTLVSAFVAVPVALALAMIALGWIAPTGTARAGLPLVAAKILSWLLATPHAAFALGLAFLIAPSGWLVRLVALAVPIDTPPDLLVPRDPWGLSLAAGIVLKEMPFLFFAGLTALSQLDAARTVGIGAALGYRPGIAWFKLVAPRLYALIRLPVYAALAYALSAVDMALVLGPATPPTLAVLAVDLTHDPDLARRFPAAALALLHPMLTLAALGLWRMLEMALARALRPMPSDGVHAGGVRAVGGARRPHCRLGKSRDRHTRDRFAALVAGRDPAVPDPGGRIVARRCVAARSPGFPGCRRATASPSRSPPHCLRCSARSPGCSASAACRSVRRGGRALAALPLVPSGCRLP